MIPLNGDVYISNLLNSSFSSGHLQTVQRQVQGGPESCQEALGQRGQSVWGQVGPGHPILTSGVYLELQFDRREGLKGIATNDVRKPTVGPLWTEERKHFWDVKLDFSGYGAQHPHFRSSAQEEHRLHVFGEN